MGSLPGTTEGIGATDSAAWDTLVLMTSSNWSTIMATVLVGRVGDGGLDKFTAAWMCRKLVDGKRRTGVLR